MSGSSREESLADEVERLRAQDAQWQAREAQWRAQEAASAAKIAELLARIEELERRLSGDSSNSSRPPSSDAPWDKKPAKKRSGRSRSGRKPGKQPGAWSTSRNLVEDPDEMVMIEPEACDGCQVSLADAPVHARDRRQVVDIPPTPAPVITEYQRISKACGGCGTVSTPEWDTGDENTEVVAPAGSPVRIGPQALARCALLTCAHYLPIGRARDLLAALTGLDVSTGLVAGVRARAARTLEKTFVAHMRNLLKAAPVLHADETPGRAAGGLRYVHVACTEYLTLMHTGDRSAKSIDAGGVLPGFTGVLVRDGYAGYTHLNIVHAWCVAHLLRDLRALSDADPAGQLWAHAMATTLTQANQAAINARTAGASALDEAVLTHIRAGYLGALARGADDNHEQHSPLADRPHPDEAVCPL